MSELTRRARSIASRLGLSVQRRVTHEALRSRARRGDLYPIAMSEIEATWRNLAFPLLSERDGRVDLMAELTGTQPTEAMHLIAWLHEALAVEGVVCEMGCADGATSALIANEVLDRPRPFWIFDSFEGLSRPTAEDLLIDDILNLGSMASYEGTMAYPQDRVRSRLASVGYPAQQVHIVAGFVPASLEQVELADQVSFAYVDFDLYEPILAGLRWLHERLAPGGIVVIDDYGWFSSGAQTAVDEFVAEHAADYQVRHPPDWAGHFVGLQRNES